MQKGDESFEDEKHSGWPLEADNHQYGAIIEADPLTTTWEIAKELHSTVIWHLKQIAKVKNLEKWVPHELNTNQKIIVLKCHLLLFCTKQWTISLSECDMWIKVDFIQLSMTCSMAGWRSSSESLPKVKLASKKKKSDGHCLVVWQPSDPL